MWMQIKNNAAFNANFIVYPGSFNPLHSGHIKVAKTAYEIFGRPVLFEISKTRCDKSELSDEDIFSITESFKECVLEEWFYGCVVTNIPLFVDKLDVFRTQDFVIGVDTLNRMFQVNYHPDQRTYENMLTLLKVQGNRFLVTPRLGYSANLDSIPQEVRHLFIVLSNLQFEPNDISSTKLRAERNSINE